MYESHIENRSYTLDEIKHEYRLTDDGDSWGTCMGWLFKVADELHFREGFTPAEWQYRPSPLGPSNDPEDYESEIVRDTDTDVLLRFGDVLHRFSRILKATGMDY